MAEGGAIRKLSKGRFYRPETTVFGELEPKQGQIVKDLLEKEDKVIGYLPGLSIYNRLGLTSQVGNTIQIGRTEYYTTVRQLERKFKTYIGITPKEYVNIIRFQNTLSIIQNSVQERSLLDIAFDCGYYDHAHLSNEIKRYTGTTPSQF